MPPRKKAAAAAAPAAVTEGEHLASFHLPKSTITKIAKSGVPEGVSLQSDIPTALQQGSVVFINYLTALAHDIASEKNQKTITAAHITEAAKQLGWGDTDILRKNLKSELSAFRRAAEAKKSGAPPPKPRVPGAPVGRPPKASTSAAKPAAPAPRAPVAKPADPSAAEMEVDVGTADEGMTVLQDDRAPEDGEEDQQAYGTAEEEDDDEEMVEDDEEEEEEEPEPEPEEEEEDRVGAGLEDDPMGGGSDGE